MFIKELTLNNVRQFEHRQFSFQPGFNLLVGENGAGKTTLLRSLLTALGTAKGAKRQQVLEDEDIRLGSRRLDVEVTLHDMQASWTTRFEKAWDESPNRETNRPKPLTLFYGSNESICYSLKGRRLSLKSSQLGSKLADSERWLYEIEAASERGYRTSTRIRRFGHSRPIREFVGKLLRRFSDKFRSFSWTFQPYECSAKWLGPKETEPRIRERLRDFSKTAMRVLQEFDRPIPWPDRPKVTLLLSEQGPKTSERWEKEVRERLFHALSDRKDFSELIHGSEIDIRLAPRIELQSEGGRLTLDQLSDGEKRIFSLVVDIARELSVGTEIRNLGQGQAIVLIDEIDVHLHPKWQRLIVPVLEELFPKCQFISTTHSPFVIQAVQSQKVQHLNHEIMGDFTDRGIEQIAVQVMGITDHEVSVRYLEMLDTARQYFRLLEDRHNTKNAKDVMKLREKLRSLSNRYAENPAYQAYLEMHGQLNLPPEELR